MADAIPSEAVGVFAAVLLYSVICVTLSTLLVCLLVSFGEKWTYVTLHSSFTALSSYASIAQQIHYAVQWKVIKKAQLEHDIRALKTPGLAFGGATEKTDVALFFIQFWCYNSMALNILFWSVSLFVGTWGIQARFLGSFRPRVEPLSKIFAIVFPGLIVGLINTQAVLQSAPATFIISSGTSELTLFPSRVGLTSAVLLSLSTGGFLVVLILIKYIKTRRLAAGRSSRGQWWASDRSKSQSSRDVNSHNTLNTSNGSNAQRSIYDRALITRFTIGFGMLTIFEVSVVMFSLLASSNSADRAAAQSPDFSVHGAITDIIFFIPGVTASLVTFLVFGTAKSWRQYRDFLLGNLSNRKKSIERAPPRAGGEDTEAGFEFERLPSLTNSPSAEERAMTAEATSRVMMFSSEIHKSSVTADVNEISEPQTAPVSHQPNQSSSDSLQFHRPRPPAQSQQQERGQGPEYITAGFARDSEDPVIQSGRNHIS